jgi:Uma2 family endonuclease
VVSAGSQHRDDAEKREEYLAFGVSEYWIPDAGRQEMLVLRRSDGEWEQRSVRPPKKYRTRLLRGFQFDCGAVFQAAHEIED